MRKRELKHLNSPLILCACGCGERIHSINWAGKQARFKTHHNVVKGSMSPHWCGGKIINTQGYVLVKNHDHPFVDGDGYVREHRLVMEKHLGRYLEPTEIVHHINGNKDDNRIENLELIPSNSAHGIIHYRNRKIDNLGRFT